MNLSYARVEAPFAGVVVRRLVEVGDLVGPGQPVAVIEDDSRLRVVAPIGADLARHVTPGQELFMDLAEARISGEVGGHPLGRHSCCRATTAARAGESEPYVPSGHVHDRRDPPRGQRQGSLCSQDSAVGSDRTRTAHGGLRRERAIGGEAPLGRDRRRRG
ncbi:MAG: HlyD family efflux transporter periplasmic adaptor subunit [Sandaracinaceae bacterium]|nr:HlyD family efflux transporter periplasmic adaptor subunit [Sandaracinaceae bacterium]